MVEGCGQIYCCWALDRLKTKRLRQIRSRFEVHRRLACIMSNQMTTGLTECSAAFPCIVCEVQDKGHMENAGICHILVPISTACSAHDCELT